MAELALKLISQLRSVRTELGAVARLRREKCVNNEMVFAVAAAAEKEKSNAVIGFDNGGGRGARRCKHVVF